MKLSALFPGHAIPCDVEIRGLKTNSREVEPGDLFLCIKGVSVDRHDYIEDAAGRGAVAAVVSRNVSCSIPCVRVDNVDAILDELYDRFYDRPQDKLCVIGVTGTDGKTSTATIIQKLLGEENCGYIGTNGVSCRGFEADNPNTTPDKGHWMAFFRAFLDHGCKYVAMEASSEAFFYGRLKGLHFHAAAISNVTSEHLNTHKTLENYIACKQQLFLQNDGPSILNRDDAHFEEFRAVSQRVVTYGRGEDNDLRIKAYTLCPGGTDATFVYGGTEYAFRSPLVGAFNVENLAEAMLVCLSLGMTMEQLIGRLPQLHVEGRMESVSLGQSYGVIVDYAHTPNGIQKLMDFVRQLGGKRIITVSGQAGGRDKDKRKFVGEAIARNSYHCIWTLEDPRNEKVEDIADMMSENIRDLNNYETVTDRQAAIEKAVGMARKGDIVLILGKGAEDSNVINGEDVPYPGDIKCAEMAIHRRMEKRERRLQRTRSPKPAAAAQRGTRKKTSEKR
ncbi:MAG: UDP-N-acetylmuramoyl-L-alanyl-D-glutamate--2,6-diaminopimelate ligase [Oscillospiraceae bacterium]|nr:UDP-N-acetylmuramoyl-L-alanyl-D-glutamate--2,6-diaminopimelate ligase [Oscillospiraceae bacterium]